MNPQPDPLDEKIDALFRSQPIRPSADFAARVIAASDAPASNERFSRGKLLAFALPLAAAIVLTLSLLQLSPGSEAEAAQLTQAEAQEIFLLEEGLASLEALDSSGFEGVDLLATLDALSTQI